MKPVGILGGTFDPIHNGHLHLATSCYERLQLREVRLIPLHTPPHRQQPVATPDQRLAMLRLAVMNTTGLKVDDLELQRHSVSYTIDTLIALHEQNKNASLCLILGADAFNVLHTWRRWDELLEYCHIIIAHRPGTTISPENPELKKTLQEQISTDINDLHKHTCGRIFELEIPMLDISATQIRGLFHAGQEPTGLLPETIIHYIQTHNLYGATH